MGVAEELTGDDVRVGLHELMVTSVETILKPVQGLVTEVALVDAGWDVSKYVHLTVIVAIFQSKHENDLNGKRREVTG